MRLQHILLFLMINHTDGLSVSISPYPVAVEAGGDVIVTSTITKTESESWKAFIFYVHDKEVTSACRGAFYSTSIECNDVFGCSLGFGFNCNYTHFNLLINNIRTALIGVSIYAEVTSGSSSKSNSITTIIQLKIPLTGVSLTPNGTITMIEKETQVFQCSGTSLPTASLNWHVGGSTLPTSSPPVITADSISSRWTYIAQKNDNDRRISCTAVYESTSFSADVLLNILYAPTVSVSPNYNPYNVLENTTNLQLACTVTDANPAVTSYSWYKDDALISNGDKHSISTVQRSHTGNYACAAANSVSSSNRSSALELNVLYGIEMNSLATHKYLEGEQLSLSCNGQSNPAIVDNDIIWTKHDNATFRRQGRQLVIENINRKDSGIYECSVVIKLTPTLGQPLNVKGTTTVEVDILYIPTVSTSPRFNPFNIIENTTNVNVTCTVTSARPPVSSFRWYKDNSTIATTATFTIQRINRSDSGRYSCEATNSIGTSGQSSQSELLLNVLYGVTLSPIDRQLPQEGKELTVQCIGQSNPALSDNDIIWTKQNNNTFKQTGKQLVIKHVNRLDSGHYICNAVITLLPSIESSVDVIGTTIVQVDVICKYSIYRPSVVIIPYYNPFDVVENTTYLQLTCAVSDSKPNVTSYRWYKDASVISTTAVYTISSVKRSNAGMYTCDATNIAGSSELSSPIVLNVLYGVTVAPISKPQASEGNELSITCDAQSNPAYTDNDVSWTKKHNTTFRQSGKRLLISNINRLDIGTFICIVKLTLTPSIGQSIDVQGTTNVEIDVLFKPMMDGSKPSTKQLIALPENAEKYINIHIVANPVPLVQWISIQNINMSGWCNNTIDSNDTYNGIYISSSILVSGRLGKYMFVSENSVGVLSQIISVELNGKPKSPSIIYVFCKSTTATVLWVQGFNGGHLQVFRVVYWNNEKHLGTKISNEIVENEHFLAINYTAIALKPNSKYTFYVVSINDYGNSSSETLECSTDRSSITSEEAAINECSSVLESGIAMLAVGSVAVFAVAMCALYHYSTIVEERGDSYENSNISNNKNEQYDNM
ncbi:unnamed protein product [Mytilus coruscus]|uniref:HMCN n=1 Tax=Mytilus coruscus TaxID=42192 RepID=A0A6J8AQW4_MYTCO|nr:unnamed protein product [Mytilus coruscus]